MTRACGRSQTSLRIRRADNPCNPWLMSPPAAPPGGDGAPPSRDPVPVAATAHAFGSTTSCACVERPCQAIGVLVADGMLHRPAVVTLQRGVVCTAVAGMPGAAGRVE